MTKDWLDFIEKQAGYFQTLSGTDCAAFDVAEMDVPRKDFFCRRCGKCDFENTHKYGCFEAQRWNGKYIYYCPAGFIFIAAALPDDNGRIGAGVLTGPIVMGNPEDFEPLPGISTQGVPICTTKAVNAMAELMVPIFIREHEPDPPYEDLLNEIYRVRGDLDERAVYPIDLEKQLQNAISDGDKKGSMELLNRLLGYIFFCSSGNFQTIKARVTELIILLSRSAIEGGADVEQIFLLNQNYIDDVKAFRNLDELSRWLTGVIERFISYVFEFGDVKHADILYKVMSLIKQRYREKLSLDEISEYVHMSKSYLSKIFKEEMDCTLTSYINQVRVEKSKRLLLDSSIGLAEVANLVGFEDQSYYTKVFRKVVGMSPGKYKNSRGKKEASI